MVSSTLLARLGARIQEIRAEFDHSSRMQLTVDLVRLIEAAFDDGVLIVEDIDGNHAPTLGGDRIPDIIQHLCDLPWDSADLTPPLRVPHPR